MSMIPGGSLFGSPKPPAPIPPQVLQPPPPLPTAADTAASPEELARKEEERKNRLRRSGLGATRLTSPGLGDDGQPDSLGG